MAIHRRDFLKIGAGSAVMGLVQPPDLTAAKDEQTRPELGWHPLTFSLIRRAEDASSGPRNVDTSQVERVIAETVTAQGSAKSPVIKWFPDPFSAYTHLRDYGLNELLEMAPATLWSGAALQRRTEDRSLENTRCVRLEVVWDIVGVEEHDRALMAPKLLAKSGAIARGISAEGIFEARSVAAQIGWLETNLPVAACHAVDEIDFLLTSGLPRTMSWLGINLEHSGLTNSACSLLGKRTRPSSAFRDRANTRQLLPSKTNAAKRTSPDRGWPFVSIEKPGAE